MQTTNATGLLPAPELGLISKPDGPTEYAARLGVGKAFSELLDATREIFSGRVWVEVDEDSELSGCAYLVFHVCAGGCSNEDSRRRREWYQVSQELFLGQVDKLRLTID